MKEGVTLKLKTCAVLLSQDIFAGSYQLCAGGRQVLRAQGKSYQSLAGVHTLDSREIDYKNIKCPF